MTTWLLQTAMLVLASAAFGTLVILVSRNPMAGAGVVLGAFVLLEATSPPIVQGLVLQQGPFSIQPFDVVSMALLSVGVWRLFTEEISGPMKLLLLAVVLSLVAHLVWGAVEFGVQQAVDYSRLWFLIVSGLVYGATVKDWDRRLPTAFIATGCFLAALSIVQIFRRGLSQAETTILINGKPVDARPVIAMGVLLMLEGLILLFARGKFTSATAGIAVLLASGIVLVQFRTLWIAAIAAGTLGAFYLAVRFRASSERVVYALTGVGLVLVPTLLFLVSQVGAYQGSVDSSTGEQSTLTWRIAAWKILLSRHSTPFDLLFGTPSGTNREIIVNGIATNLSAHNTYVEAQLLYGLVGVFALSALGAVALRSRRETARQLEIAAPAVVVLVVTNAIVWLTTQPDQLQGLLFGSLLSAACLQRRQSPAFRRAEFQRRGVVAAPR